MKLFQQTFGSPLFVHRLVILPVVSDLLHRFPLVQLLKESYVFRLPVLKLAAILLRHLGLFHRLHRQGRFTSLGSAWSSHGGYEALQVNRWSFILFQLFRSFRDEWRLQIGFRPIHAFKEGVLFDLINALNSEPRLGVGIEQSANEIIRRLGPDVFVYFRILDFGC